MNKEFIIRCDRCAKVMKGKAHKGEMNTKCPHCHDAMEITISATREDRRFHRVVVGENRWITTVPEPYRCTGAPVDYRVMYTEVPPIEFIMNRPGYAPLLDFSEGGMGLFVRADKASAELMPGSTFITQIDMPVLVQPIITQVEVRWIRPIREKELLQIGVRFCETGKPFREMVNNLKKYIASRSNEFDFDKWGAFA